MDTNIKTSKETDITGILVGVLVLLIGVLVVKVSTDFTGKSTSTSTRAAPPMASAEQTAWCKANSPLNGDFARTKSPGYDASKDFCAGPMTTCGDLKDTSVARDMTDTYLSMSNKDKTKCGYGLDKALYQCCRSGSAINAVGDNLCKKEFDNTDALCYTGDKPQQACKTAHGNAAATNVKCAKPGLDGLGINKLYEGYCCNVPLTTTNENCGRDHVNCTKFNASSATDNELLKNTDKAGVVKPVQCATQADGKNAMCVNQATYSKDGNVRCDGSQFADKVYGQSGCFTTVKDGYPASTNDPVNFYCAFVKVSLSMNELCKDKIARY